MFVFLSVLLQTGKYCALERRKKLMYKCVDLIAVFEKNSETSLFEGRGDYVSPLQCRGGGKHCMVIRWVRVYDFSCGRHK